MVLSFIFLSELESYLVKLQMKSTYNIWDNYHSCCDLVLWITHWELKLRHLFRLSSFHKWEVACEFIKRLLLLDLLFAFLLIYIWLDTCWLRLVSVPIRVSSNMSCSLSVWHWSERYNIVGVDFKIKQLKVRGKRVKLTIWDTG